MKVVWGCLVVLLAALVIYPPDFGNDGHAVTGSPSLPPFQPNARAKALGAVPGGLVCPDESTIQFVFASYSQHAEDVMQDAVTDGAAHLVRGPNAPSPRPDLFGCSVVPAGSPVQIKRDVLPGVVEVIEQKPNGEFVYGVTQVNMLSQIP